jgi:hypothetical protein
MRPDPPLPDRRDLERELAGRTCPEPPADLRNRILAALAAQRQAMSPAPHKRWRMVWQAAAAVILAGNLVLSAANGLRSQSLLSREGESAGVAHTGPLPEPAGNEPDARFWAFAANALTELKPAPDADSLCRHFFEKQEN